MPKHVLLTDAERNSLFAIPSDRDELARHYLLSQADIELIGKRRKPQNKFGVALQLSLLRHPGFTLAQVIEQFEKTPAQLMVFIAEQLFLSPSVLGNYASREQTMTDHALNIMDFLNLRPPIREDIPAMIAMAADAAFGTDKGCEIVDGLLGSIRQQKIALPNISTIERVAIAGRARARKQAYHAMSIVLSPEQLAVIDNIFDENPDQNMSYLSWLKAMPVAVKPDHIREILARLQFVRSIEIDPTVAENVHINRYRQFVSEGRASASYMIERYISSRRRAIVIAFLIDVEARLTDAAIEMADKLIGSMFTRARNAQTRRYAATAKDVSRLMKLFRGTIDALSEAIEDEGDPYELIEAQVGWANLVRVREEVHQIAETSNEDPLLVAADRFATLRKFTPQLIEALEFKAGRASAKTVAALEVLKQINRSGKREIPVDAPMPFKKEWQKLIVGDDGKINRRLYETATFAHLRNKLRSGDVWVEGSSAYRRFDSYLLAASDKATLEQAKIKGSADTWIREKAQELDWRLKRFAHRLKTKKLEGVVYTDGKLQITPVKAVQLPQADALGDQINAMMPPIRITELLHEVARETGFLSAFTNLRTGEQCPNESALLAAILADATNLGIARMAAASQGITRDQLIWTQDAYVRDECYRTALANIIDSHHKLPISQVWGTGTTSSSDGQFFVAQSAVQAAVT
jgi:TnpA family transposase